MSIAIIAVIVIVAALLLVFGIIASRYQKVAPNEVLLVSGRKHTLTEADGSQKRVGHRVVKGGGTFVLPVVEVVNKLSLNAMTIDVSVGNVYTKEGVPVNVDSVVIMKIGGDDVSISNAAERFLKFSSQDIQRVAKEALGGHLRAICSTLTPEEINKDRISFQQQVLAVAHKDFASMGLQIDSFTVRNLSDEQGYLNNLGKKSAAEVKKNAIIGEADALDKVATRAKAEAVRDGQVRQAETQAEIANAERERDIKKAKYSAEVSREKAMAEQAAPKATAESRQDVIEAEKNLALKEAELREKQLITEKIKPAEAEKQAAIINAEADKQAMIINAEAQAEVAIKESTGKKQATILQAEAQKQAITLKAEATQFELTQEGMGEANKKRNVGEAEGAATRATGTAEADVIKAKLLAEAEGTLKKAEAMKAYNEAGAALQLAQQLIATLPNIVKEASAGLASIESIRITDFGSGNGNGQSSPINKILNISPQAVGTVNEVLKQTMGVDLNELIHGKAPDKLLEGTHDKE